MKGCLIILEKDKDIIVIITDDKTEKVNIDEPAPASAAKEVIITDTAEDEKPEKTSSEKPSVKPLILIKEKIGRLFSRIKEYFKSLPRDLDKRFMKVSFAAALVIVLAATLTAYFIPKSEHAVSEGLERLMQKDSAYLDAKNAYDSAAAERDSLTAELELKKQALDEFHGAQDSLNKITESNAELEKTRDQLKKDINAKQSELDSLSAGQEQNSKKISTLSSGSYTVGTDIAEGTYTITGTGSIAIANSGRSTANKLLKADGETFTLKTGDRVQIEGSAKLIPQ